MKVTLVVPLHHSHLWQPPLALGYLGAYLLQNGHEVRVLDGLNSRLDNESMARRCRGADLVGISRLTDYWPEARDLTQRLKSMGLRVVLGGPHPSVVAAQSLRESGADFAAVGEGELSLLELVRSLDGGGDGVGVPGILAAKSLAEGITQPVKREHVKDLDELPFPDWDQIPPGSYPMAPHGGVAKNYPIAPITSSRGCPYACTFCSSPFLWDRKIRFRSPRNVLDEIEYMVLRHGVKEVHFEDDNLTMKREHIQGIAEGILSRGIRISWATPNGIRVDKVDRALLALMKQSGCYSVAFGIESADPEVLRRCGKRTSIEKIEEAIRLASEAGLITQGFFIFGLPGETEASIARTISFAKRSRLDKAQFLLLDMMPGTQLWEELPENRRPDPTKYQSYHDMTWCPEGIDPEVLRKAPSRAFRTFFASPRRILNVLRLLRPGQLQYVFRRLSDFRVLPVRH